MLDQEEQRRPDVSIIVVNYRSVSLAARALKDAVRSAKERTVEEIVADAGSSDEDLSLLQARRPAARIVRLEGNPGFAAGNNAAIAQARGRYLLLLNPDAFAQDDAVRALVLHLDAHPDTGLLAPSLLNEDGSVQDNVHRRFPNLLTLFVDFCAPVAFLIRGRSLDPHHLPRRRLTGPRAIAHATGAVLLVRTEAAAAAGPLDERYFLYLEETEWQRRLAGTGWRREALPEARFIHVGGGSTGSFPLASPHYLASVRRYYARPRLAMATIRVAALISFLSLRLLTALGVNSPRVRQLADGFDNLQALLTRRCRPGEP
jgi:GT2 family glycosyltransferase